MLGACLKINVKGNNRTLKSYIINPINDEKIYIILDPCHMEKLLRNRWATCQVFFDANRNKIEWRYIVELYKYSCKNDFQTHKLSKKHIEWKRHSMNVRIAAETFSESVASSLEYLMDQNVEEFQGAKPTIDFIKRMDRLFNIFNSRNLNDDNLFKRRLCAENQRIIFDFFEDTTNFFKTLKVEEVFYKKKSKKVISRIEMLPILNTRHKTGFRGFIIDMASVKSMFREYVEEKHLMTTIATYNLLQDALEMLFGRIRACGGFNNNPNVLQFKGAFRKIQYNMRMELSTSSNCRMFEIHLPESIFFSNIYFVSSKRARIEMNEQIYESQKDSILHR